jgi:bile acid-coenzyme A ligase
MTDELISMAARVRQLAAERPDEPVYRHLGLDGSEPIVTWGWLDRRSDQLAGALRDRGLGVGDRLGIGLRNSPEFVLGVFAAWKLGAVPVPVRWDVPDWELTRLRQLIAPPVYLSADDLDWIRATDTLPVPDLPEVLSPHTFGICSSGSTGTPKVILSALPAVHNPLYSQLLADSWSPVPRPQTVLVLAPMYHVNAFSALHNLLAGDVVLALEKFDAARAVDAIERYGVTNFTATPTMLQRMADLDGIDDRDLSSLVWFTQGAAPMPPSLVHRWAGLIGAERIIMAYGMTEGLGLTGLRGDEWMSHPGSVGKGLRDTEVRILGPDGADLPSGEIGEIYLRSPMYGAASYLGEAPPLPTTDDGFHTVGDVGYLDDDDYLYLVDRRVDMIITGGANVFPAEVETALIDHPKIADVVVIGLRDDQWGHRVHAVIEAADPADPPTTEEVIAYAKDRLAPYKVPKTVEVVDRMDRSEATKVNRGRMVEAREG